MPRPRSCGPAGNVRGHAPARHTVRARSAVAGLALVVQPPAARSAWPRLAEILHRLAAGNGIVGATPSGQSGLQQVTTTCISLCPASGAAVSLSVLRPKRKRREPLA
jgi:hypothetical protein